MTFDEHNDCDRQLNEAEDKIIKLNERITELETAKTIGIQACDLLKEQIEELKAGQLSFAKEMKKILNDKIQRIKELEAQEDELAFQLGTLKDTLKSYQRGAELHIRFVKETDRIIQAKAERNKELERVMVIIQTEASEGLATMKNEERPDIQHLLRRISSLVAGCQIVSKP